MFVSRELAAFRTFCGRAFAHHNPRQTPTSACSVSRLACATPANSYWLAGGASDRAPFSAGAQADAPKPLAGVRVLELGQLIAGPFAGTLLGYFGAEVIKVEPLKGGDPLRKWRVLDDEGTSLWWRSIARNKKSITLDLKQEQARDVVRQLASSSDVIIENFRPGRMEKWGLGPDDLKRINERLIYCRISGYGQSGPYSHKPGFASVCEAIGGLRYVNGFPGEAPVRANLSLGDTLAALHATIGILMSLLHQRGAGAGGGTGQVVDVALYESVFNMLEAVVPEYDRKGVVREPSGSTVTGIVPTNTYLCQDRLWVVIGGNGDSIFTRLMQAIGREDLAQDPRLASNEGRVQHQAEVDGAIGAWTASHPSSKVLEALEAADVPSGPLYSVREMFKDPHFQARGMFETVEVTGEPLQVPAILPKLADTPGSTQWAGPDLGEHNQHVLGELLGYTDAQISQMQQDGIISSPR